MKASYICKEIYKWIQEKQQYGEIHSIFKNTINILSEDGKLIPVILRDRPMFPNSIKLEGMINFKNLNIKTGEKGIFTKDSFTSDNIIISFGKAILWDRKVIFPSSIDAFENFHLKLKLLKEVIYNEGNKDGIYSLMKYIPGEPFASKNTAIEDKSQLFIKDRFIKFIDSFIEYDINNINIFSKKIIGFGSGLTPSMDDFLSGMMIANIYISYFLHFNLENAYKMNHEIVKGIENMTTLVSEEMLKISALGEANEDIRDLMIALIGTSISAELKPILGRVIDFGHSSGTDILCGIYVGSYLLMEKYKGIHNI